MAQAFRPLAVVTGASSGIGLGLARCCASAGHDLVIAADDAEIEKAALSLRSFGVAVEAVEADLSTKDGVDLLCNAVSWGGRAPEILCANAGIGLGGGFLDQDLAKALKVVDTNVSGTLRLLHRMGRDMRANGAGRILITGSIAGFTPGAFQAVYNGTKAFLDSFSFALRAELEGSGVSVTCLMPGVTDTEFFARAELEDTKLAHSKKDDPDEVARIGFDAMMRGEGDVVSGWSNKLKTALALITPAEMLARTHKREAEPGSARKE
ncbi:short-subunit dehydrogenase [Rhodoblastus acidophilus]|uniref:SDR family NAD(P)-dependent oxidoreductase n=1 Tax=Rhodoblastus acidophilus TaxID=1074 RepID=UPI002224C04A|nr:SDR family NAD(P)-dependent oxidoreductase [Rhodoblastus acidophilus]MCW2285328.1 short-subunit dehydrogenase [Rhodoblastus acidophilus]MCW2334284.1 short-subunit dehydrogenase [Rhodoblastus acidophilus]